MRLTKIARNLYQMPRALATVTVIALLSGVLIAYHVSVLPPQLRARQYHVKTATVMVLVDTPRTQALDLGGTPGADIGVVTDRATLLASLVTLSPMTQEIAAQAGVPAGRLVGVPEKRLGRQLDDGPQVPGSSVSAHDPAAFVLRAKVPILLEGATPIIEVTAQAPDAAAAARLANATITALRAHVQAVAASQGVPLGRALAITQLSSPSVKTVAHGLGVTPAAFGAFVVFLLGCGAIELGAALRRGPRNSSPTQAPRERPPGPRRLDLLRLLRSR